MVLYLFSPWDKGLQNECSASSDLSRKLVVLSHCYAYRQNASSLLKIMKKIYFILTSDL